MTPALPAGARAYESGVYVTPAPPDRDPGEGYEWRAIPDNDWRVLTTEDDERKCSFKNCTKRAIVRTYRMDGSGTKTTRHNLWYCGDHMFGRWIVADPGGRLRVMFWVIRKEGYL